MNTELLALISVASALTGIALGWLGRARTIRQDAAQHHFKTDGNILDQSKIENRQQGIEQEVGLMKNLFRSIQLH